MIIVKKTLRKDYDYRKREFVFKVKRTFRNKKWKKLKKKDRTGFEDILKVPTPIGADGRAGIIPPNDLPSFFSGGSNQDESSWTVDINKWSVTNMCLSYRTTKYKIIDKDSATNELFFSSDNLIIKKEIFTYNKHLEPVSATVQYKSGRPGSKWTPDNLVRAFRIGTGGLHSYDNPFSIEEDFQTLLPKKMNEIITSDITQCDMGGVPLNLFYNGTYEANGSMILR